MTVFFAKDLTYEIWMTQKLVKLIISWLWFSALAIT